MGLLSKLRRNKPSKVGDAAPAPPSESASPVLPALPVDYFTNEQSLGAVDVMADMLFRIGLSKGWCSLPEVPSEEWTDHVVTGVSIKSKYGVVRSCPPHAGLAEFGAGIEELNAKVAIKMQSKAVDVVFASFIDPDMHLHELYINADTRIQIIDSIPQLGGARKNQYAAFIRDEGVLVVWADRVDQVVPAAESLEKQLIALLWSGELEQLSVVPTLGKFGGGLPATPELDTAKEVFDVVLPVPEAEVKTEAVADVEDPERAEWLGRRKERPIVLLAPVVHGLATGLTLVLMFFGIRALLMQYIYDHNPMRFCLAIVLPFLIPLAAFPCSCVMGSLIQLIGPVAHFERNSAYYSSIAPPRSDATKLLPITVQIPVYKEGFDDVIIPTIESLQAAIVTFERQGGSVNVIVCDDGLQLHSEEERKRRIKYYEENNLAYVARPPHGQDGFLRRGRFKKAGNLNYTNLFSLRIEEVMDELRPEAIEREGKTLASWSEVDEKGIYQIAFARALAESEGKTWAHGNVRIGEIILLIDSDTRVPVDCFLDASLEMAQSPQLGILQHASGVMQVAHHFFENAMAFFTQMLQVNISYTVSNGDTAPFVGHNAFLRWSALQECAHDDGYDGRMRVWSESHVSEDFQVALTLQSKGWVLRWATYSNLGFQEGVSLTCQDELSRWQKYSWGCSEIVFNPIKDWFRRGPFTKLFFTFLRSPLPTHSKWGIMSYIFSYYALSISWWVSILNYLFIGVWAYEDSFYCSSWRVFFACVIVFQGLGNFSCIVLRYRLHIRDAGKIALQQIKWLPFFTVFFSGLSFAISTALVSHLVSYNMAWTSTLKSVERSNFFLQLPAIWKRFWLQISVSVVVLAGMIVCTTHLVPPNHRVQDITIIIPLGMTYAAHFLWPFVLDPYFTTFTF